MSVIPLECPSCGTGLKIDPEESAAICGSCGKPFVIKDAIVQNYIKIVTARENGDSGIYAIEEFETEDGILKRYNGTSRSVTIPDDITTIGSGAFEDRKELTELHIPDSVSVIEDNAFVGCENLREITLADSVKKIGRYAFSECSKLKAVALPKDIEEIGPYAFGGCFSLCVVKMPSSRAKIDETAFMNCKDVVFDWPEDWAEKQLDKLRIVAPTRGGLINLCASESEDLSEPLLFLGASEYGNLVESNKFNFFTYRDFMRQFSLGANNDDPYQLRVSIERATLMYDSISDIQRSYSELIGLLDCADISRRKVEPINIPHFIWKQGKGLNDYKVMDIGPIQVLQIKLVQK